MICDYIMDKFEIAVRCFFGTLGVVFLLVMILCTAAVIAVIVSDLKKQNKHNNK